MFSAGFQWVKQAIVFVYMVFYVYIAYVNICVCAKYESRLFKPVSLCAFVQFCS